MRFLIPALLLAACTPEPAAPPETPAPETVNEFESLPAETAEGQWFLRSDEGVQSAGFGLPESEFQFMVVCTPGSVSVSTGDELSPDQDTTINLITEAGTLSLPARSFNEGLPSVSAELEGQGELAQAVAANLAAPQTRFGVRIGDHVSVYPWDTALTQALESCR